MDQRDLDKIRRQAWTGGTFSTEVVTELLTHIDKQDSQIIELLWLVRNRTDELTKKDSGEGVDEDEYKWLFRAKDILKELIVG